MSYYNWNSNDLETTINQSTEYFLSKNNLLLKLYPKAINGKYVNDGYVDYIGFVSKTIFFLEAKATIHPKYFYLSKISTGQQYWLNYAENIGVGLLIFYFKHYDAYILIRYNEFKNLLNKNSCNILNIIKNGIKIQVNSNKSLMLREAILKSLNSIDCL